MCCVLSVSVPPDVTVPCGGGKSSYSIESKEVNLDNRPSQSALLSYVHKHTFPSGTPSSYDAVLEHEDSWQPRLPKPPSSNSRIPQAGEGPQSPNETRSRIGGGKTKTTNYRSIDDVGRDLTYSRAMLAESAVALWMLSGWFSFLIFKLLSSCRSQFPF